MHRPDDAEFHLEVLKLLVHVAWADGVVAPEEVAAVVGLGRGWRVPEAELAAVAGRMLRGEPRPAPNMSVLRTRAEEVVEAVRTVVKSDGKLDLEELDVLATISDLLGLEQSG